MDKAPAMTRERMLEIFQEKIRLVARRDGDCEDCGESLVWMVKPGTLEDAIDAALAEMAGEWNEALDLAAHIADVQSTDAGNDQWEMGAAQIAKDIRALRRPDAAPAPHWSYETWAQNFVESVFVWSISGQLADRRKEMVETLSRRQAHVAVRERLAHDAAPALPAEPVTRETVESWLAYFDAHADEFAASHADLIARLTRPATPSVEEVAKRPPMPIVTLEQAANAACGDGCNWPQCRCSGRWSIEQSAKRVLALFAKERS